MINVNCFLLVLSRQCQLFKECEKSCGCTGCTTGPANCTAQCNLPPDRGGYWFCDDKVELGMVQSFGRWVKDKTKLINC